MAATEIYLKVSGRYYPCEPRKAWLRRHLPVMLWVWWFERKLMGVKWGLFLSWNMSCPVTIHRMKVEKITKDELVGEPEIIDYGKTVRDVMDAFTAPTEGVEGDE